MNVLQRCKQHTHNHNRGPKNCSLQDHLIHYQCCFECFHIFDLLFWRPSSLQAQDRATSFFRLALSSNPLKSHSCWRRRRNVAAKHSSKTEFLPGQLGERLGEIVAGETREGLRDDCRDLLSYFELFCSILRKSSECRDLLSYFEPVLGIV